MRYSFESRVRYSEINKEGILSIPSIINYFQDASTFQSEELGVGIEYLKEKQRAWVLNSWQINFIEEIKFMENIKISTWASGFTSAFGTRSFTLESTSGKRYVEANSIWVFTDTKSGRPVKVTKEQADIYGEEEAIDMINYGRKITVSGEGERHRGFEVLPGHIDTNGHVNNGKYIEFAMEHTKEGRDIKTMRVEYKKAALLGDKIIPVVYNEEYKTTVSLETEDGNVYSRVQFIYGK